jgi:hypothetical protein
MGKLSWVALMWVAAGVVACGGDDEANDEGPTAAAHVCSEQIACGYQLADQDSCVQLFEAFFTRAQIADCDACVSAEPCETEQNTCMQVCSL